MTTWQGCYDAGWKGLIVEDAFAHPAKFSRNLIGRIYRHMIERGWLAPGMTVVDPFGGVALGALDAMANGLHWRGCELESRFVTLGQANIAEWTRRFGHSQGWGTAQLIQGDSRRLGDALALPRARAAHPLPTGSVEAVVSSPPYSEGCARTGGKDLHPERIDGGKIGVVLESYGSSPGQLGAMPAGSVEAVVSSPPYADHLGDGSNGIDTTKMQRASSGQKRGPGTKHEKTFQSQAGGYSKGLGNLGNLRPGSVDACVSSPPYEGSLDRGVVDPAERVQLAREMGISNAEHISPIDMERIGKRSQGDYGRTDGQLGGESSETFWSAAREIVLQCAAILRPGGVAAFVTKDFVRDKKRVPFSADWVKLCEACGFRLVEWVKASLVKDLGSHADLYGDVHHRKVERKSFFRRLAEKKGSPRIDEEDVLFLEAAK